MSDATSDATSDRGGDTVGGSTRPDGEVIEIDGRRRLRFVRRYPYPIDEVWSAVSEPDRMARWAFAAEYEPRVGGSIRFIYGDTASRSGTVLAFDPPNAFEYEWADEFGEWHVRLELEAHGGDTELTFDHLLPDPSRAEYAAGWHWYLDRLDVFLRGALPAAVETDAHFDELMARYQHASP